MKITETPKGYLGKGYFTTIEVYDATTKKKVDDYYSEFIPYDEVESDYQPTGDYPQSLEDFILKEFGHLQQPLIFQTYPRRWAELFWDEDVEGWLSDAYGDSTCGEETYYLANGKLTTNHTYHNHYDDGGELVEN